MLCRDAARPADAAGAKLMPRMLWRIRGGARESVSDEPRRLVRIVGSAREGEFIPPARMDFLIWISDALSRGGGGPLIDCRILGSGARGARGVVVVFLSADLRGFVVCAACSVGV